MDSFDSRKDLTQNSTGKDLSETQEIVLQFSDVLDENEYSGMMNALTDRKPSDTAPGRVNGTPSRMDTAPGRVNGTPSRMDAATYRVNGTPSGMDAATYRVNGVLNRQNGTPDVMNVKTQNGLGTTARNLEVSDETTAIWSKDEIEDALDQPEKTMIWSKDEIDKALKASSGKAAANEDLNNELKISPELMGNYTVSADAFEESIGEGVEGEEIFIFEDDDSVPEGSMSVDSAMDSMPLDSVPVDSVVDSMSLGSVPEGSMPMDSMPLDSVPVDSVVDSMSLGSEPEDSVPVDSMPTDFAATDSELAGSMQADFGQIQEVGKDYLGECADESANGGQTVGDYDTGTMPDLSMDMVIAGVTENDTLILTLPELEEINNIPDHEILLENIEGCISGYEDAATENYQNGYDNVAPATYENVYENATADVYENAKGLDDVTYETVSDRDTEIQEEETQDEVTDSKEVVTESFPPVSDKELYFEGEGSGGLKGFFAGNGSDKVVIITGIIVVLFAFFVGYMALTRLLNNASTKNMDTDPNMGTIGNVVYEMGLPGEDGINAIVAAEMKRVEEIHEAGESYQFTEVDEVTGNINVSLALTTVCKDIKVKVVNDSNKLIAGVPFKVSVKKDAASGVEYSDDNKDGIIYLQDIAAGKYSVKLVPLDGYETMYNFTDIAQGITVKDTLEYKKVDVSNEVKTEAQVDVAKEDSRVHESDVESMNENTVEYISSQVACIGGEDGYAEIDRNTEIENPVVIAKGGSDAGTTNVTAPTPAPTTADQTPAQDTGDQTPPADQTPAQDVNPGAGDGAPLPPDTMAEIDDDDEDDDEDDGELKVVLDCKSVVLLVDETEGSIKLNATVLNYYEKSSVKWSSSDTAVAVVDTDGNVTALNVGTATIRARAKEDTSVSAKCKVTVKLHPRNDYSTKLVAKDGRQVYVKNEDGTYAEAVFADYYRDVKLYVASEPVYSYTGWQVIDNNTYYFDKDGKYVTGEQVIQGAKYNFASDGTLQTGTGTLGIDVSKWNGTIDWSKVAGSGVSYAIIRCGFRGSTEGGLIEDKNFEYNIEEANKYGIKVGVYFFTQALNEIEAVEEASMVLEMVKGHKVSYPIFIDTELANGRGDNVSVETRTAICKAFCKTIQNAGYTAGIYANRNWFTEKINTEELTDYKIWLAQYAAAPTYTKTRYDLWQYSDSGTIDGISGNVDMNLSYLGY